ncbi:hypothetical protein BH10BAC2_BH10BAC2_46680 [soil metagenome]
MIFMNLAVLLLLNFGCVTHLYARFNGGLCAVSVSDVLPHFVQGELYNKSVTETLFSNLDLSLGHQEILPHFVNQWTPLYIPRHNGLKCLPG